jgi:hypothetical protein
VHEAKVVAMLLEEADTELAEADSVMLAVEETTTPAEELWGWRHLPASAR